MHVAYLPGKKGNWPQQDPPHRRRVRSPLSNPGRLTPQVAETLQDLLQPQGVAVICEARHFCMMMRGVEKQHSGAITSAMLGASRNNKETRNELLSLIGSRSIAI